jgi:hypothetical protein
MEKPPRKFVDKCIDYLVKNSDSLQQVRHLIVDPMIKEMYPFMRFVVIILIVNAVFSVLTAVLLILSYSK